MHDLVEYCRYLALDFSRHLILVLVLALLGALIFSRLGRAYGIDLLFWHEHRRSQFGAGASSGLLFSTVGFVGYLLDENQVRTLGLFARLVDAPAAFPIAQYVTLLAAPTWMVWLVLAVISPLPARAVSPPYRTPFVLGAVGGLLGSFVMLWYFTRIDYPPWFVKLLLLDHALPPQQRVQSAPLHATAAIFVLALCAINGVYIVLRRGFTPAIALCTLLGLVAAGAGFMEFHAVNPSLLFLVFVALLAVGGQERYKLRLPALSNRYRSPVDLRSAAAANAGRVCGKAGAAFSEWEQASPEQTLPLWSDPPRQPVSDDHRLNADKPPPLVQTESVPWALAGRQRPLVLVCASGGGLRAALWTAHVLSELESAIPDFASSIRIVAGASGGMVGASMYSLTLSPDRQRGDPWGHDMPRDEMMGRLGQDSLSAPLARLLFNDLFLSFLPIKNERHRGDALDACFRRNFGAPFSLRFGDTIERERTGELPSLVFTPMFVEDGRRLLISNLDCGFILRNDMLVNGHRRLLSRSGREFARLFPYEFPHFPVRTAACLSAAFPYVSPAVSLPTVPRRRVVDAGYYDNYGVNVCAAWLADCFANPARRRWLEANVSRIHLVQIRDSVSPLSGPQPPVDPKPSAIQRGFEEFLSPLQAAASARESVSVFRNDEQLEQVLSLYNDSANDTARSLGPAFVRTDVFAYPGDASLSWYLSAREQADIRHAASGFQQELKGIYDWWYDVADRKSRPLGIHIARTSFIDGE